MAKKRITELATETTLKDGQYVAIDHTTDGTKKLNLGAELTDLKEDIAQVETAISTLYDMGTPSTYNNDKVPYLLRPSGGGKYIGRVMKDVIVGGSVGWNQLVRNGNFADSTGWSAAFASMSVSDGEAAITTTGTYGQISRSDMTYISGHKYLFLAEAKSSDGLNVSVGASAMGVSHKYNALTSSYQQIFHIANCTSPTGNTVVTVTSDNGGSNKKYTVKNVCVHDLTQMFGSTIADYIYSLEQATAGSGIAKLKSWGFFTEDYYPYDSGSLKSVESLTSHDMVGFNQWDEEWELGSYNHDTGIKVSSTTTIRCKNYIPAMASTSYFALSSIYNVFCYADDYSYLGPAKYMAVSGGYIWTTKPNTCYITFRTDASYGTTYNHDICINLSSSKNGTYEPYEKHSYALDSDLTLRGIPKLDSSNQLYYDGDIYKADGSVTRKYAVVDLGTLSWTYDSSVPRFYFAGLQSVIAKPVSDANIANIVCSKYTVTSVGGSGQTIYGGEGNGLIAVGNTGTLNVRDSSYSDVDTFKTAMSGVYLVYELATPTTETADPYQNPQIVDKYGTEEYVTTGIVPVGHDTDYYLDADSVLTPPSTAGTYSLKVTVASDGSKSYSWVSD